ncbi:MAG: hypothetical protein C0171_05280 [Caldisphaera sp.]|jgi:uncharacterized protein YeaO (DUF488 family)|uniref:DUF488 domain-containing protein n=1 Tax=Caldisphaera sp. TaxID=2060322 RepID=UPI000CA845A2|nr:MAG: hypothetical protein C0171_05280 [Caldisphaera sp.]
MIKLKRVYDKASPDDGLRILVERLWPRGIKKENAKIDLWFKEVAPSNELRKWFSHDPKKWLEFKEKYYEELNKNREAIEKLLDIVKNKKDVTLIYSSKDKEHNNAVALKEYLENFL